MANNLREIFQVISENIELGDDFKIEDIPELELPENFNDDFHNQFLTRVAAKNDSELMAHYKGKYLGSADLKLKHVFTANGGTEDEFNELKKQEPDTLKLFDLVYNKVIEAKPNVNDNIKPDKALEQYKKDTIKQIEALKLELSNKDVEFTQKLATVNSEWENNYKSERINALLSSKKFDSQIPEDDLKMIINSKINNSNYDIRLDENKQFKVYKRDNPEALALKDGKEIELNDIIDEFSQNYIKKNDQAPPERRKVEVPSTTVDGVNGKFIPGHPDYGK